MRKNSGPNKEPCGTRACTRKDEDLHPCKVTHCSLPHTLAITMISELIQAVKDSEDSPDVSAGSNIARNYEKSFKEALKNSELSSDECKELILTAISAWREDVIKVFVCGLLERRKPIDWPTEVEFAETMLDDLVDRADRPIIGNQRQIYCHDFFDKFIKMAKSNRLLYRFKPGLYNIIKTSFQRASDANHPIHSVSFGLCITFPWKVYDDVTKEAMGLLTTAVEHNPALAEGDLHDFLSTSLFLLLTNCLLNGRRALEILPEVTELAAVTVDAEWTSAENSSKHTLAHTVLKQILDSYLSRHTSNMEIMRPNMPVVRRLWECGDEDLENEANSIMRDVARSSDLLGDDAGTIVDRYLSGEDQTAIASFPGLFKQKPQLFYDRLDELVDSLDTVPEFMAVCCINLYWEMAKAKPELFKPAHLARVVPYLGHEHARFLVVMFLGVVASSRPEAVVQYDDDLIKLLRSAGDQGVIVAAVLVSLSKCGRDRTAKYLAVLWEVIQRERMAPAIKMGLLWNFRQIGALHMDLLLEYKPGVEKLKDFAELKETVQGIIDLMEGRSLEHLSKEMEGQREDITELDDRVTTNEQNISNMETDVDDVRSDVREVKGDVITQEARIDDLEEVVDDTVDKVEQIDRKTLSHAPTWSRDVAKLLNPVSDHDWRLLSGRLGYSADDVKNWATQSDPCLSMLDEWFATHKTREATYAILKALEEMNRVDAAMIVENALKNVDGIVEEDTEDPVDPPPIFISYQWAHQAEVKLLRQHLEMAGFQAWMDIGQMGGGDKLFAKIDQGIRAAKVVICCVSEKYAQSPNCNREVNLSVTLGKPVIPLLMEQLSWPPPGTMGPIFSEYLFIRFFQREAETTSDDRYWLRDKFQELLMQLRYSVIPNYDAVDAEYQGWWNPPEENVVIQLKNEGKSKKGATSANVTKEVNEEKQRASPAVFISYQWGKQPQVRALYHRLSEAGFSCWLDIMQMGGGDSLYDKIDKGIRGCKLMVSCVTSKYSLSANCRREVSLADALKRPIVPLLLEKTTWPPEGPMSMVFTQLLYINCTKPDLSIQDHWKCEEFNTLLSKIGQYAPSLALDNLQSGISKHVPIETDTSHDVGKIYTEIQTKAGLKDMEDISGRKGLDVNLPQPDAHVNESVESKGQSSKQDTPQREDCDSTDITPSSSEANLSYSPVSGVGHNSTSEPVAHRPSNTAPLVAKKKSCCVIH